MKEKETIGSKGTVPGFRPLIGKERWHRDSFSADSIPEGFRPLLSSESPEMYVDNVDIYNGSVGFLHTTKRPLPPPAVETFEAHGHIWYKHTPGDVCPVETDVEVDVLWAKQMSHPCHYIGIYVAKDQNWSKTDDGESVIGYRFPDYPAVHVTLQQEQPFAERLADLHVIAEKAALQLELQDMKQQLTSIYNGWVHLPPETVAECIADVASVLYPTDADRCEAAFEAWKRKELGESAITGWTAKAAWKAAWKASKESKV